MLATTSIITGYSGAFSEVIGIHPHLHPQKHRARPPLQETTGPAALTVIGAKWRRRNLQSWMPLTLSGGNISERT